MNVEGLGQYISYVNYWFNHLKKGKRKMIEYEGFTNYI
jgi:hypothetical protein